MIQDLCYALNAKEKENADLRAKLESSEKAKNELIDDLILERKKSSGHSQDSMYFMQQAEKAEKDRDSLQAQCAAMRQALENLLEKIEDGEDCFEDIEGMNGFLGKTIPPDCLEISDAQQALSTTAGADLLTRVREVEKALKKTLNISWDQDEWTGVGSAIAAAKQALAALVKDKE